MVDIATACQIVRGSFPYKAGAFYGPATGVALGVGLICDNVLYPLFDRDQRLFDTVAGMVYVLTHECDIDTANERQFNDQVLICPIIPFADFVQSISGRSDVERLTASLLPNLAADNVFRVMYLPEGGYEPLGLGGFIYLNQICSTHVGELKAEGVRPVCALSEYAQEIFDRKIQNHLLRPKADRLPLSRLT